MKKQMNAKLATSFYAGAFQSNGQVRSGCTTSLWTLFTRTALLKCHLSFWNKSFRVRAKKGNDKVKKKSVSLFEKQLFASANKAEPVTGESLETSKSCRNLQEVTSAFVRPAPQPHPTPEPAVSSNGSKIPIGWQDLRYVPRPLMHLYQVFYMDPFAFFPVYFVKETFYRR